MATENVKKTTLRIVVGPCDAEPLLTCVKGVTELGFDSMTVYLTAPETEVYDALKPLMPRTATVRISLRLLSSTLLPVPSPAMASLMCASFSPKSPPSSHLFRMR